jgi:hypothetical protein
MTREEVPGTGRSFCLTAAVAIVASLFVAAGANAAAITVTSGADDGSGCTLREAVVSANMDSDQGCTASGAYGDDAITFDIPGGPPDTVLLTGTAPEITGNVTITGPGAGDLLIDGTPSQPTLHQSGGTVVISDLSITGGGGYAFGTNQIGGGGIYKSGGALTLNFVRVFGNNVVSSTNNAAEQAIAAGGGIYVEDGGGNLTINDSVIEVNTVSATHGGTGMLDANAFGAGIASGDPVAINRSTIDGNVATAVRNNADSSASHADARGGGVMNYGVLTIDRSTISNNTTSADAGDNDATISSHGAGIFANSATASSIELSTIARNRNERECPGCSVFNHLGGGIDAAGATELAIVSSTIAGNGPVDGNPMGKNLALSGGADVTLQNTIVADPWQGGSNCNSPAALVSLGHNLEYSSTPGVTCDTTPLGTDMFADADLLPLDNYGGPTDTMGLPASSPAVDAGTAAGQVTDPGVDQRGPGFLRPSDFPADPNTGDGSDIGATELQNTVIPPVVTPPFVIPPAQRPAPKKCKKPKKKTKKALKKFKKCKKAAKKRK